MFAETSASLPSEQGEFSLLISHPKHWLPQQGLQCYRLSREGIASLGKDSVVGSMLEKWTFMGKSQTRCLQSDVCSASKVHQLQDCPKVCQTHGILTGLQPQLFLWVEWESWEHSLGPGADCLGAAVCPCSISGMGKDLLQPSRSPGSCSCSLLHLRDREGFAPAHVNVAPPVPHSFVFSCGQVTALTSVLPSSPQQLSWVESCRIKLARSSSLAKCCVWPSWAWQGREENS